jgi:predicted 3-demethylubiquinone-9 3-methyltransferase (glyoxalase superfamily)
MHEISYVERDGKQNAAANERTVQTVAFTLAGLNFIAMDMDDAQLPAPSWANSYLVEFTESSLYEKAFGKLSAGGTVMMSADDFGIYQQVCWITDQFGITWQLVCLK